MIKNSSSTYSFLKSCSAKPNIRYWWQKYVCNNESRRIWKLI